MEKQERDPIKSYVSLHAAERFAERVMGLNVELSYEQAIAISYKIKDMLDATHPIHKNLPDGQFSIPDQDITIVKEDGRVITVMVLNKVINPKFKGGCPPNRRKKRNARIPREKGQPYNPEDF